MDTLSFIYSANSPSSNIFENISLLTSSSSNLFKLTLLE